MFPEGTPDMQSLLQQAARMQEQLVSAQEELSEARVEGTSGGGAVTATVSGTGELLALSISPAVIDPAQAEDLADLIVAAVRNASGNAERLAADQMSDLTGGFGDAAQPPGQLGS
jgi:DNA-binding YbaB/EbfC family protein